MEIGSSTSLATPAQQVKVRIDEADDIPPANQEANDTAEITEPEPASNTATDVVIIQAEVDTPDESTNTAAQTGQTDTSVQGEAEPNPVRDAILSLGDAEPVKNNAELFREQSAGVDVADTKLNPQSITELATSAFEQRQTERSEDRTSAQTELREKLATEESSRDERIVDVNA